jgi:hypothetical protein
MLSLSYAKFYKIGLYAECHYAECLYAKCHSAILCQEARPPFFLFLSLIGAETFSINNTKHNDTQNIGLSSEGINNTRHFVSLCRVMHFFIVMLSDVILIVVFLSDIIPTVLLLSVFLPSYIIPSLLLLSVILLSV